MDKNSFKYVRIQGREKAYMTRMPVGIFAAVSRLEKAGILTNEEKTVYNEIDSVWFEKNLPNPPFYDDDNPGKPITWFKKETKTNYMRRNQMINIENYGWLPSMLPEGKAGVPRTSYGGTQGEI